MAIKVTLFILLGLAILIFAGLAFWREWKAEEDDASRISVFVFGGLLLAMIGCIILIPGNIHQVDTGEVAVVRHMGKVTCAREPGVYWDWYFTNDYEYYDTKIQSTEIVTKAYTSDAQTVDLDVIIQYQVDKSQAEYLATTYGSTSSVESKMEAVAFDRMKSVIGQNDAEYTVRNRSTIKANIEETIASAVNSGNYCLFVPSVDLRDLSFSDSYEAAAEARAVANQKLEEEKINQAKELALAENNHKIEVENAKAAAEAAIEKANAEAEVARIKAQADQDVAKIEADTALYAGQKNAAIALQKLASVNGWTVVTYTSGETTYNKLVKPDETLVTAEELAKGVEQLVKIYTIETWDGKLPTYQMGDSGIVTVVTP